MNPTVPIEQLEPAINRFKQARPVEDGIVPIELRLLADVYGLMIYRRAGSIHLLGRCDAKSSNTSMTAPSAPPTGKGS